LFGTTPGVSGAEPVAVPLHDLTSIRAPQHDKSKTALLIAAIAAGTAGGVFALTQIFGGSCVTTTQDPEASNPQNVVCP